MIKLQIKKQDGSLYWTDYFNDNSSCENWVKEEKTRHYWDATYSLEARDEDGNLIPFVNGKLVPDPAIQAAKDAKKAADEAAQKAKLDARKLAKDALAGFDKTKIKNLQDAIDALEKIVKSLGLDQ